MVLRDLPDGRIGGGDDGERRRQRDRGYLRAAETARHRHGAEPRAVKRHHLRRGKVRVRSRSAASR